MNQKETVSKVDGKLLLILAGILLAAVAAAALMLFVSHEAKRARYEEYLGYGYASMDAQSYNDAITAFENAYLLFPDDESAIGLAKAWNASGNIEKAIQVVTSRMELYESTPELEALLEEYKVAIGYYSTVTIAGKTVNKSDTTILFKDVTLTEEDKQALSEFTDVVTLSLVNCGLTDISFLQNCTKLMSVTLTENPISDFTPLLNKPDLRTLYINDTAITDYEQLHGLTTLTMLNANGNWITVAELDALRAALPGTEVYAGFRFLIETFTLGGISFNSDATELNLSGTGVSDTTVLKKCTRLNQLDLSGNKISWISGLEEVTTLTWLNLSGNRLSNISKLDTLTRLTYLDLTGNTVTDITPTAGMTELTELYLSGNPIYHGHANLSQLTKLQKLDLSSTLMQDKYLVHIPMDNMTHLDLRGNKQVSEAAVQDLMSRYPNCTILSDYAAATVTMGSKEFSITDTAVDASYSTVTDLSPARSFTALTELNLSGNGPADFAPLKELVTLTTLNLHATGFADCSLLSPLTNLTDLTLSGNPALTDLTPLVSCTKLTQLNLDDSGVTDIAALQNLPALESLHLDRCAIADFSPLHTMTDLKTLYIADTGITPEALYALEQALPNCSIYPGDVVAAQPTPDLPADTETQTETPAA